MLVLIGHFAMMRQNIPRHLEEFRDLTALPPAEHFLGRVGALSNLLDPLLSPSAHGFVMLHGLGGIGKTSLARVAAERVGWYYQDRVLAVSFETFSTLNANNQRVVNEAFVDRFYASLCRLPRAFKRRRWSHPAHLAYARTY